MQIIKRIENKEENINNLKIVIIPNQSMIVDISLIDNVCFLIESNPNKAKEILLEYKNYWLNMYDVKRKSAE